MHFTLPRCSATVPRVRPLGASRISSVAVPLVTPARPQHGLNVSNGQGICMMRHRKKVKKLNKPADQRKALIRALTTEVIRHGRITTSKVRAKAIRPYVDKMITLAKDGSLHAQRQAFGFLYDKKLVYDLFKAAPGRYANRNGGYCRVLRTNEFRRGDNTEMATIELM